MKKLNDDIRNIADHYGYEAQARQTMEECSELTVALNKQWRLEAFGGSETEKTRAYINIVSEIADVGVMLAQLIYLLDCETDVLSVMDEKVERQLRRIEESRRKGEQYDSELQKEKGNREEQ